MPSACCLRPGPHRFPTAASTAELLVLPNVSQGSVSFCTSRIRVSKVPPLISFGSIPNPIHHLGANPEWAILSGLPNSDPSQTTSASSGQGTATLEVCHTLAQYDGHSSSPTSSRANSLPCSPEPRVKNQTALEFAPASNQPPRLPLPLCLSPLQLCSDLKRDRGLSPGFSTATFSKESDFSELAFLAHV